LFLLDSGVSQSFDITAAVHLAFVVTANGETTTFDVLGESVLQYSG
jgi:hypothetical protein